MRKKRELEEARSGKAVDLGDEEADGNKENPFLSWGEGEENPFQTKALPKRVKSESETESEAEDSDEDDGVSHIGSAR